MVLEMYLKHHVTILKTKYFLFPCYPTTTYFCRQTVRFSLIDPLGLTSHFVVLLVPMFTAILYQGLIGPRMNG
jgi:hypothetical protein